MGNPSVIKPLVVSLCACALAGCALPDVAGNDVYATVARGDDSEALARAHCHEYGKVPQLLAQDAPQGMVTYDCVFPPASSPSDVK